MTDSFIPVGDTGKNLNSKTVTTDAGSVENEIVELYDGTERLNNDTWGTPRFTSDFSLFQGTFTFEINNYLWKKYVNGSEVIDGSADAYLFAEDGGLVITDTVSQRNTLYSLRHPKYQPNRGHKYSTAGFIRNFDASGTLYLVIRNTTGGTTTETRSAVDVGDFDLSKGNLYDSRIQWRGVGDITAFVNLIQKYTTGLLGSRDEISISNPAFAVYFEARKGAHTIGGLARAGSAVRWGLATEENGFYFEFEYSDDRDPRLEIGCVDVTSEGGNNANRTYWSALSGSVTLGAAEEPVIAIRVPETRTVGAQTPYNTIDLVLKRISSGQSDEHDLRVYRTRDPSAISITGGGQDWVANWSNDCEFIINNDSSGSDTFTFDDTKCDKIFETRVETDLPFDFESPNNEQGPVYLTNGDILIVSMDSISGGTDIVSITIEGGAER